MPPAGPCCVDCRRGSAEGVPSSAALLLRGGYPQRVRRAGHQAGDRGTSGFGTIRNRLRSLITCAALGVAVLLILVPTATARCIHWRPTVACPSYCELGHWIIECAKTYLSTVTDNTRPGGSRSPEASARCRGRDGEQRQYGHSPVLTIHVGLHLYPKGVLLSQEVRPRERVAGSGGWLHSQSRLSESHSPVLGAQLPLHVVYFRRRSTGSQVTSDP